MVLVPPRCWLGLGSGAVLPWRFGPLLLVGVPLLSVLVLVLRCGVSTWSLGPLLSVGVPLVLVRPRSSLPSGLRWVSLFQLGPFLVVGVPLVMVLVPVLHCGVSLWWLGPFLVVGVPLVCRSERRRVSSRFLRPLPLVGVPALSLSSRCSPRSRVVAPWQLWPLYVGVQSGQDWREEEEEMGQDFPRSWRDALAAFLVSLWPLTGLTVGYNPRPPLLSLSSSWAHPLSPNRQPSAC